MRAFIISTYCYPFHSLQFEIVILSQCRIPIFYGQTVFLKLVIARFSDTQDHSMMGTEGPKTVNISCIWRWIFVSLEKILVSKYL